MSTHVTRLTQEAMNAAAYVEGAVPTEPLRAAHPTLVYWDICGLGEACRLALAFAVDGFDDVRLHPGDPGGSAGSYKAAWLAAKPVLAGCGMAFPNLPYYLAGSLKLTQSNAILRHIQRTSEKFAFDDETKAEIDMSLDQLVDADNALTGYCYRGSPDSIHKILAKMDSHLAAFDLQLRNTNPDTSGSTEAFVGRGQPSIADFKLYELVRKTRLIAQELGGASAADPIARYERLQQHFAAVEALPAIREYLDSAAYQARPLNNPTAHFK
jgi:glutathione S-transferase